THLRAKGGLDAPSAGTPSAPSGANSVTGTEPAPSPGMQSRQTPFQHRSRASRDEGLALAAGMGGSSASDRGSVEASVGEGLGFEFEGREFKLDAHPDGGTLIRAI